MNNHTTNQNKPRFQVTGDEYASDSNFTSLQPTFENNIPTANDGFTVENEGHFSTVKSSSAADEQFNQVLEQHVHPRATAPITSSPIEASKEKIDSIPVPPKTDGNYYPMPVEELPSKGIFYPNLTHLNIRRFNLLDISNLHKARVTGSYRIVVDTINSSIENFNAYNLTEGDFQFILYWHRINSYKRNPLIVKFKCRDEGHISKVITKTLEDKTLNNEAIINNTLLEPLYIDDSILDTFCQEFYNNYKIYLYPPRMEDVIELNDLLENDKEVDILDDYAKYINPGHIKDRITAKTANKKIMLRRKLLDELNTEGKVGPDFLMDIDRFIELCKHGVKETVKVKCAECGEEQEEEFNVDLLSFFRRL